MSYNKALYVIRTNMACSVEFIRRKVEELVGMETAMLISCNIKEHHFVYLYKGRKELLDNQVYHIDNNAIIYTCISDKALKAGLAASVRAIMVGCRSDDDQGSPLVVAALAQLAYELMAITFV